MNEIAPERAIIAAQAACPFPLSMAEWPHPELPRLNSEFPLLDQDQFGSPAGVLVTNMRFCGRTSNGWLAHLLRDVTEVAWRENRPAPKPARLGLLSRLIDGPPKRVAPSSAGTVEMTLRNGHIVSYSSARARAAAEALAALAKSVRSLTG